MSIYRRSSNSLYTDNSNDSDQLPIMVAKVVQQQIPKTLTNPLKQQSKKKLNEVKQKDSKVFCTNYLNDIEERAGVYNALINNEQSTPKKPVVHVKPQKNFRIHQSIQNSQTRSNKRYSIDNDEIKKYKPKEYISFAFENQKNTQKNYNRHEQIKRQYKAQQENKYWEKDSSIPQNNNNKEQSLIAHAHIRINQKELRTCKYLVRHFHKHGTLMNSALNKYISIFQQQQAKFNHESFKISLFDNLSVIKLKMEAYLQTKINLNNFLIQKPTAQWSQQQLTSFYIDYKPLLKKQPIKLQKEQKLPMTLKKYKNCVYFGKIVDGKKQGEGILHYFSGKFFQGYFLDDHKQFGLQIDEQELYIGSFTKGVREGEGVLKTHEGLYAGIFFNGIYCPKQGSFEINHSRMKLNTSPATCILKNNNGDIFVGCVNEKEQKEDEGLEIFSNGDIYIGRYEAGSPQGYGQYYWDTGAFYRGQFLSGMRHGRGVWQMLHGDQYEGQYMNDKKNGEGVYLWKNGSKYSGHFENDYRHGYGEMIWQDGRTYKGMWLNGIEKNTLIQLETARNKQSRKHSRNTLESRGISKGVKSEQRVDPRYAIQNRRTLNSRGNSTRFEKFAKMNLTTLQPHNIKHKKITANKLHFLFNPASNFM